MSMHSQIIEKRRLVQTEIDTLVGTAEREKRDFTNVESKRFDALVSEARQLDERLERIEGGANARHAAARVHALYSTGASVTEPDLYGRGSQHSYILDTARSQMGDSESRHRLEVWQRERRDVTPFGTSGSDFAFPEYLVDDFIAYARPGRVIADVIRNEVLPPGRDTLIVPSITGGSTVEPFTTEGGAVSNTLMTQSAVSSPVVTVAGQQIIAQQMFDLSPANIDRIVMQDLAADYAKKLEEQILTGSGSGGNVLGLVTATNTNTVTYTTSSPTAAGIYRKVAEAATKVAEGRYMPATAVFMTPRRWASLSASVDSAGRPLITASDTGAFASMGVSTSLGAGGPVGRMHGMDVYVTNAIGANYGAATNEDRIIVARAEDIELWESAPRFEIFPQPYAMNLAVLARYYSYMGLIIRYGASVSVIGGTGLVSPDFS